MVLLAVTVLLAAATAYSRLGRMQRAAEASREDLQTCRKLVDDIKELEGRPAVASEQEKRESETTARIEQAAKDAGIREITSIAYQEKQRIEKTSYKKKPIRVSLKHVTTRQLVTMLHSLKMSDQPLRAETISLDAPDEKGTADIWNVDMVLTYWIYEPQSS